MHILFSIIAPAVSRAGPTYSRLCGEAGISDQMPGCLYGATLSS